MEAGCGQLILLVAPGDGLLPIGCEPIVVEFRLGAIGCWF